MRQPWSSVRCRWIAFILRPAARSMYALTVSTGWKWRVDIEHHAAIGEPRSILDLDGRHHPRVAVACEELPEGLHSVEESRFVGTGDDDGCRIRFDPVRLGCTARRDRQRDAALGPRACRRVERESGACCDERTQCVGRGRVARYRAAGVERERRCTARGDRGGGGDDSGQRHGGSILGGGGAPRQCDAHRERDRGSRDPSTATIHVKIPNKSDGPQPSVPNPGLTGSAGGGIRYARHVATGVEVDHHRGATDNGIRPRAWADARPTSASPQPGWPNLT